MAPVQDTAAPSSSGVDEFLRSQITPSSSITPLDRRPLSRPHLLEVSAAQQRQQDSLRESSAAGNRRSGADSKTSWHNGSSSAANTGRDSSQGDVALGEGTQPPGDQGKPHLRSQVPSATAVSYKGPGDSVILTQPISLLGAAEHSRHGSGDKGHASTSRRNWERSNDGRKSRKGMREGEEEDPDAGPTPRGVMMDLGKGASHRAPRVKSAHTSQDMVEAMDSIRQLQGSLTASRPKSSTLTSATGTYIKQLIKETNDEIQDLTDEIDDKIEHKLQEVRQLQHHQQGAVSAQGDFVGGGGGQSAETHQQPAAVSQT
ncbi:hypothetical protein ACOMHN_026471 [Nucella lapillus]